MFPIDWSISSLLEPDLAMHVRQMLGSIGCEEISAVFLLPAASRIVRLKGKEVKVELKYPLRVDGSARVYLRSHGRDFNIIPPEWIPFGLSSVFSIGPGVDSAGEQFLLALVQSFSSEFCYDRVAKAMLSCGGNVKLTKRPLYNLPCARISALFRGVTYPLVY